MKHIDDTYCTTASRQLIEPSSITTFGLTRHVHIMRMQPKGFTERGFKIPYPFVFSSLPRVTIATSPAARRWHSERTLFIRGSRCSSLLKWRHSNTESHYHNLLISLRDRWMDGWMNEWVVEMLLHWAAVVVLGIGLVQWRLGLLLSMVGEQQWWVHNLHRSA